MYIRTRIFLDLTPDEKIWLDEVAIPHSGLTKIAFFRLLLDKYAAENKLPPRPQPKMERK